MDSFLRRFVPAVIVLSSCLVLYWGCASKKTVDRETQQSLVRSLEFRCKSGDRLACDRIVGERELLWQVYGCHCIQSPPLDHKPVW